jgi:hypothetical protein
LEVKACCRQLLSVLAAAVSPPADAAPTGVAAPLLLLVLLLLPLLSAAVFDTLSNARLISSVDDVTVTFGSCGPLGVRAAISSSSSGMESGKSSSCKPRPAHDNSSSSSNKVLSFSFQNVPAM